MPDQHVVIRLPFGCKFGLVIPVEAIVIQWFSSHLFAGNVIGPRVEPDFTRTLSPQAAVLISSWTSAVVECGPCTLPGEDVPLMAVYMHSKGILAGPSVVGPIQVPEGV